MKIHIVDIQDGNGRRLIAKMDKVKAIEVAGDWLRARERLGDPAAEDNFRANMDALVEGQVVTFIDAKVSLLQTDLDMSGVLEVLEDAQHTLNRNQALLRELAKNSGHNITEGLDRAQSRYVATEQVIHLMTDRFRR